jgi:hypothetical protein
MRRSSFNTSEVIVSTLFEIELYSSTFWALAFELKNNKNSISDLRKL